MTRLRAGPSEDGHQEERALPRPEAVATPLTQHGVLSLQRTIGNAAISRLLSGTARLQRETLIEPTEEAMGEKIVDGMVKANRARDLKKNPQDALMGVFYSHRYRALAKTNPYAAAIWTEDCRDGYANRMFKRVEPYHWRLLPGYPASVALKTWLNGPTIAECATVLVAIELDTIRAAVGDARFDELFSDLPGHDAERGLLTIDQSFGTSSTDGFLAPTAEASATGQTVGRRAVKKGEFYYFSNHPKYVLKHPDGAFQGENAICMDDKPGAQKYSGFGVGIKTEPEMLDVLAQSYNAPRTERDFEELVRRWRPEAAAARKKRQKWASLYAEVEHRWVPVEYWKDSGWPDQIDAQAILDAPALEVEGVKRKGGFVTGTGVRLSADAVQDARGQAVK